MGDKASEMLIARPGISMATRVSNRHTSFHAFQRHRGHSKGVSLKTLLDAEAVDCLARNIALVYPNFEVELFHQDAVDWLAPLGLMQRVQHGSRFTAPTSARRIP